MARGKYQIREGKRHMYQDAGRSETSAPPSGIRWGNGLILINLLNVILIIVIIFSPSSVLRVILVIPFLMFFPGYTLLAAIFARKGEIGGVERVVLSVVLSLVIEALIGLFLNYTPWGIRLEPVLYSISVLIFLSSIIAWLRQRRLARSERFWR